MKTPSSDLYYLIHALNKAEKRYFKSYAQRHIIGTQNDYMQLFDAIETQKKFDEAKLKKKLVKVIDSKTWASTKKYLYQQVLESLHHFHLSHSIGEKIKTAIHVSRILLNKHLVKQAEKLIAKTQKQIEEYALYEYIPEFFEVQRLYWTLQAQKTSVKDAVWEKLYKEADYAIEQLVHKNKINQLNDTLMAWHWSKGVVKKEEDRAKMGSLVTNDALLVDVDHKNIRLYILAQQVCFFIVC
ncbi:MAG: hypothetical protein GY810_28075 [Aureispira sp.]|nr:hypothetical protein [Aureispira sp.]